MDREPILVDASEPSVHPIPSTAVEVESEHSDVGARDEGIVQRVAVDRSRRHRERLGVGDLDEARPAYQDRRPRPSDRIHGAHHQERELWEERSMPLRQVIEDQPAAARLDLFVHAEATVDRPFAPMEG